MSVNLDVANAVTTNKASRALDRQLYTTSTPINTKTNHNMGCLSGYCLLLLFLLVLSGALVTADNIFRSDYSCQSILLDADVNEDGAIDRAEYLGLINEEAFSDFDSFEVLPLSLQANFLSLACLCEFDTATDEDCCSGANARLSAPDPFDKNRERSWYFDEICRDTFEAIFPLTESNVEYDEDLNGISSDNRLRHRTHMPSPSPNAPEDMATKISPIDKLSVVIVSAEKGNAVTSSTTKPAPTAWHTANRHYFIPIVTLIAFILLALAFSMYITMHRRYQYQRRDKSGFVLGSFPSVLPAVSTLTDRNNWNEGGCFEATSLDEQDCGISFECSYDMSEVSSRISLRSIRVPSLWLVNPYGHYKPFTDETMVEEEDGRDGDISPMTSVQGSDYGSDIGSPIRINRFGGDHFTM